MGHPDIRLTGHNDNNATFWATLVTNWATFGKQMLGYNLGYFQGNIGEFPSKPSGNTGLDPSFSVSHIW